MGLLEAITGKARRTDARSAAFPARAGRWNVTALAVWTDPAHDDEQITWARSLSNAIAPWSLGSGYVNYAAHDEPQHKIQAVYGPQTWARLQAVERR